QKPHNGGGIPLHSKTTASLGRRRRPSLTKVAEEVHRAALEHDGNLPHGGGWAGGSGCELVSRARPETKKMKSPWRGTRGSGDVPTIRRWTHTPIASRPPHRLFPRLAPEPRLQGQHRRCVAWLRSRFIVG